MLGLATNRDKATDDAADILRRLWADPDGSVQIPVDVVHIARRLDIGVFDVELDPNISGAIVKEVGSDPTILLNRVDSDNRKRFTCAHELGHYFLRVQAGDDAFEFVDERGPVAAQGVDQNETYANKFAASLLMPEAEVRRRFNKDPNALTLAIEFHVSPDAMRFRLENLGLIAPSPPG